MNRFSKIVTVVSTRRHYRMGRTTRNNTTLVSTAVVFLVASMAAQAANYSIKSDWSDSANPNGVWTYREGNNALPHVASWQSSLGGWNSPQPAWAESENANNRLPVWFKSNGSENFGHDWLAGDVIIHSTDGFNGIGNGLGNVLWTSPSFGSATITGGVWIGRDIGRAVNWSLLKDGMSITGGSLSSGDAFHRANPFLFSAGSGGAAAVNNLAVSPGTTVELRFTTASANGGDFVGVDLNLTVGATNPSGDFNNDGNVDAADYVVWRKNTVNNALPNDNGLTTQAARFDLWRAKFGNMAGSGAGGSAAIPEPGSCMLLLVAAFHLAAIGRRSSKCARCGEPYESPVQWRWNKSLRTTRT
jgi:hypothetical protein